MIFSFVFPISGTEWKDKESGTKVVQGTKRVHIKCINYIILPSSTAASVSLLTKKTLAASTAQPNVQISIIQPGRDHMMTTHAVDLLLSKLPPEAHLAHQLPGLINNLPSVTILYDAGWEVFIHKTGCEVTLDEETILQGWRDPKNCL
jgi:hypothetical protein